MTAPSPEPTPTPAPPTTASLPPTYEAPASQADLDRIISDRVARERAKYADHADLKAKAARLEEIESANATDMEKAVKAARSEGESEANQRANARLVKSEARALAAAANFRDAADAVAFLDLSNIRVGQDGEVDGAAVKTLLDALSTSKPYLLTDSTPPPPPPFNGGPRTLTDVGPSMNDALRRATGRA